MTLAAIPVAIAMTRSANMKIPLLTVMSKLDEESDDRCSEEE